MSGNELQPAGIGLMSADWDWQPGARTIVDLSSLEADLLPASEVCFSSDGQLTAWICMTEDGEFQPVVNGQAWEQTYDNIWNLRFTPDNRLLALVSSMGTWTLALDGDPWPEEYEYIWNPMISRTGEVISAAVKKDGVYGIAVNGADWPVTYPNANGFTQSCDGDVIAAVVQTESLDEGDINTFWQGIYTVSVNGQTWPETYVNVWSPCCWENGSSVAATVRLSPTEYSIAVDGQCWPERYTGAWEPVFHPSEKSVIAPVRLGAKWALAQDGRILWPADFHQLWHQQVARDGTIAAIVAPRFGQFTVAKEGRPWTNSYPVVTDLVLHQDGGRAAAVGQAGLTLSNDSSQLSAQQWQVIVDDAPWSGWYDRVFPPVFSQDGHHVAVRVEHSGKWTVLVDDRPYSRWFDRLWDPIFSPDSRKLLIKALDRGSVLRIVADLSEFGL
jgi:hypothetical protein